MARTDMIGAGELSGGMADSELFFELGLTCATGRDGAADLVEAHKWFNIAAMRGNDEAARFRQEIAREMGTAAVATAQRAARDWLRMH